MAIIAIHVKRQWLPSRAGDVRKSADDANEPRHRERVCPHMGGTSKGAPGSLGRQIPVAAVQEAALSHPHVEMRRFCLFLLDHYASDVSSETFRRALRDPVAPVRESALHGLACETCRHEDIAVPGVVTALVQILASDRNAEVRHKSVAALARFVRRDTRAAEAIARAAAAIPIPRSELSPGRSWIPGNRIFLADNRHCATPGAPREDEGAPKRAPRPQV